MPHTDNSWPSFHFLSYCGRHISGFGSFWMKPFNGAVIQELWGKTNFVNPVFCVVSEHTFPWTTHFFCCPYHDIWENSVRLMKHYLKINEPYFSYIFWFEKIWVVAFVKSCARTFLRLYICQYIYALYTSLYTGIKEACAFQNAYEALLRLWNFIALLCMNGVDDTHFCELQCFLKSLLVWSVQFTINLSAVSLV